MWPFKREKRAGQVVTTKDSTAWLKQFLGNVSGITDVKVNDLTVKGVATVFACVDLVCRTLSTVPLVLYRESKDGQRERMRKHPLYNAFRNEPHPLFSATDFIYAVQQGVTLHNNGFFEVMRDGAGRPRMFVPVEPWRVTAKTDDSGNLFYQVEGRTSLDKAAQLSPRDLVHIKGHTSDGLFGKGLLNVCPQVFALAIALHRNAEQFFSNGSRPGGVLEIPTTLSDEAYNRLKADWEDLHKGLEKAHNVAILEEGLVYKAERQTNDESQFHQSREYQDRQIAKVFGVPPHKIGLLDRATFANIEHQNAEFLNDTMRVHAFRWEQQLNRILLSEAERSRGFYFEFLLDGINRGDTKTRYEAYNIALQSAFMTVNEVRQRENLSPVDGGDKLRTPLNMAPANSNPPPASPAADDEEDEEENSRILMPSIPAVPLPTETGQTTLPNYTFTTSDHTNAQDT